jgi:hypothetical protein
VDIPIAILSSSDFYAPLMLSSVTQEPLAWFGVLQHPLNLMALGFDPKVKDVNGDGLRDLVVKFRVAETRIVCGGPTRVFLRGLTDAGIPVQSVGTITLKGCK